MSGEARTIEREYERELVQTEALVVEMRAGARAVPGQSRNISLKGIYVETRDPPEVGEDVQLFVGSTSGAMALRADAKVVHVEAGEGFGARFLDQSTEAREYIEQFIARVRKQG